MAKWRKGTTEKGNKRLESPLYHLSEMSSGELSRASTGLQNAIEGAALTH